MPDLAAAASPAPSPAQASALPRLALSGIHKRYPAVVANDDVSLTVAPGEIHGLIGENGAGKSTLMKIIYGAIRPDSGRIAWDGREVSIDSPSVARALGIGMVFQHFALFETLTVVENVALMGPGRAGPGKVDRAELADRIRDLGRRYGVETDPARPVHGLSVGERQRVEIIRALLQSPRLLILDEPTSVLTPKATEALFETLRQLAAEGVSILYVSHKLEEVRSLCSRVTVLRAGRVTGVCDPREQTVGSLSRMMIGAEPPRARGGESRPGAEALVVRDLDLPPLEPGGRALRNLSLTLHRGEIVGIAGISGNGQGELLAALAGEDRRAPDEAIRLFGRPIGRASVAERRAAGLRFVPEERLGRGAVPSWSLARNLLLTRSDREFFLGGLIRNRGLARCAAAVIDAFQVKAAGPWATAGSLSGGNLQKYLVGRELTAEPSVLLIAQPTWGVDVGAAARIRQALVALRDRGAAVLVVSEDLDELFEIADVLTVLAGGTLSERMPIAEATIERIGARLK